MNLFYRLEGFKGSLCLPHSLRPVLSRTPPGSVLVSSITELKRYKYKIMVSVGDHVSALLLKELGASPKLVIIDCKIMRDQPSSLCQDKLLHSRYSLIRVRNPRSQVTREALEAIHTAIHGGDKVALIVDGEEDLLALPSILFAPNGSIVAYGHPHTATLLVKATNELKQLIYTILGMFEEC